MDVKTTEQGPAKGATRKSQAPKVHYNLTTLRRLSLAKKPKFQKVGARSDSGCTETTAKGGLLRTKGPVLKSKRLSRHCKAPAPEHLKKKEANTDLDTIQSHPQESSDRIGKDLLPIVQEVREPIAGTSTVTDSLDSSMATAMTIQYLQTQIHRWLIKTGKNNKMYHYLFTYSPPSGENKENIENEIEIASTIFDDLEISSKEKEAKLDFLDAYALLALIDLKNMMSQGFPVEHGLQYLELIERNHESLLRNSTFWMYKGEVFEASGHVLFAVQCYKTAIKFGAKKKQVTRRLDGILEKFSGAMMNQKKKTGKNLLKHQTRMIDEVKEIFRKAVDIFP